MSFKEKVVIVTGAGQGIGFEICKQLTEKGAVVLLNDIDSELCNKAAEHLSEIYNAKVHALTGDCGDIDFIKNMVRFAVDKHKRIDSIIANAGITLFADFLDYTPESFNRVVQVNLFGSFFLAQEAARQMKEQKSGGSILFMSSVTGHLAHKGLQAYGTTKAALEALARNLVIDLAPLGINCNTIAPGATLTERTGKDENYEQTWNTITPDKRVGRVSDMAHAALFFIDERSRHITGQNIVVDGGWTSVGIQPE